MRFALMIGVVLAGALVIGYVSTIILPQPFAIMFSIAGGYLWGLTVASLTTP